MNPNADSNLFFSFVFFFLVQNKQNFMDLNIYSLIFYSFKLTQVMILPLIFKWLPKKPLINYLAVLVVAPHLPARNYVLAEPSVVM